MENMFVGCAGRHQQSFGKLTFSMRAMIDCVSGEILLGLASVRFAAAFSKEDELCTMIMGSGTSLRGL